ncbi:Putative GNAT domain, acyl-CoA N-acyltransferase [Colletotrichum destructivum]|uniref:GNAT domain, acyl-CoA N-acyltransferase n=1 Tax=Colletotrichum destructivum TaxID=34406 RepID=A0AAX4HW21_9PEZI|nr:Putative GNAT domain, acyl-CoA N-acyltransferase [Colletotrichum destructivum]
MTVPAPGHTLSFRPATPADIPALLPLIRSAYRGAFPSSSAEADIFAAKRATEATLLTKIAAPDVVVLHVTDAVSPSFAVTAAEVVPLPPLSCCEIARSTGDAGLAHFGLFAVDPARQAGGVGGAVLRYAEELARREWSIRRMEMTVLWMRAGLIAYYERRGYRRTGERREFPYAEFYGGEGLRDDLWFVVLEKEL